MAHLAVHGVGCHDGEGTCIACIVIKETMLCMTKDKNGGCW